METRISQENDDQPQQNEGEPDLELAGSNGEQNAERTIPVGTDSQDQTDITPAKADEDMQRTETTDPSNTIDPATDAQDVSMEAMEEIEAAAEAGEDAVVY